MWVTDWLSDTVFVRACEWKPLSALSSPGFWRCSQPLVMFLKSDEICSNLLERQRQDGKVILVCVQEKVCVCHREIKHNRSFQMTCWCPQRVCHYLIATVRSGRLIGHRTASQETDIEDIPSGPTTNHAHRHTDVSLHWGEKAISFIHTHAT